MEHLPAEIRIVFVNRDNWSRLRIISREWRDLVDALRRPSRKAGWEFALVPGRVFRQDAHEWLWYDVKGGRNARYWPATRRLVTRETIARTHELVEHLLPNCFSTDDAPRLYPWMKRVLRDRCYEADQLRTVTLRTPDSETWWQVRLDAPRNIEWQAWYGMPGTGRHCLYLDGRRMHKERGRAGVSQLEYTDEAVDISIEYRPLGDRIDLYDLPPGDYTQQWQRVTIKGCAQTYAHRVKTADGHVVYCDANWVDWRDLIWAAA